ncbi:Hypothetical predicted protein [Lecanosticta acicola]|uniref:Histone deacetylase domain-containing protein n=1 Tax=Lecanosticta acicola TaxID=111012 RepID=A0AAI8Z3Q6_9PEZI|nr:Hypothetical predicted protein [Lecanosticta acicola]
MDPNAPPDIGAPAARSITLETGNELLNATRQPSPAATGETNSPISGTGSAPPTPSLKTPRASMRPPSQPATSPVPAHDHSPRPQNAPVRRASSSASLNRPCSSPRLVKKGSRSSLGAQHEDHERRPTPKRSISNLISNLREAQATMEAIEEPTPRTATEIATEHFARELLGHSNADSEADTVVILHDACYGHRYSRLKTTKTTLSMIVERPERIHASVLGASTAYVRLGGHHAEGKQAPHPERTEVRNPPFKIKRTGRSMDITSPYVTAVHGAAWMSELRGMCHSAPGKLAAGTAELSRSSTPGEPEKQTLHEGDLYLAPGSLNAFQGALGGVADAVDAVFSPSIKTNKAFVAVRPPGHHCSADHPSGFCWLNNVHVGIEYAAQTHGLTHAAILDFDLHHGDGSQAITWNRNSKNHVKRTNAKPNSKLKLGPDIGYYSIHDINSYPCEMGDDEKVHAASLCIENAHGQSIWNVHLQPWKTEDEFWQLYEERYSILLEKAHNFLEHHNKRLRSEGKVRPKAAIFISAGFDASEWEGSGMQRHSVNVPTEFYARFTQDIVKLAQGIDSCGGRVISVLEGGYSDRALCSGVLGHLSGLCCSPVTMESGGLGGLMSQMNGLSIHGVGSQDTLRYKKDWWSASNLTALESKVNPPPPPPQGKKGRIGPQPTYATPTESFAYKVIDVQKFARTVSGTMREGTMPTRPPTPPPPEVDWIVATQELSKLLIPTDRQTKSCTSEELAVPRGNKERHSDTGLSTKEAAQPRQLRDRRAKGPVHAEAHSDESRSVSRAESRASRRETISVLPSEEKSSTQQRRASRRLSAVSAEVDGDSDANAPPIPPLPSSIPAEQSKPVSMKPPPIPVPSVQANGKKVQPPTTRKVIAPTMGTVLAAKTANVSAPMSRSSTSHGHSTAPAPKNSDVDNLTSGMKRITLKVSGTKEEHDRKQKEKLDAERRARALKGAETRRVNAAAKKAALEERAAAPNNASGAAPSTAQPSSEPVAAPIHPGDAMQVDEATGNARSGPVAEADWSVSAVPIAQEQHAVDSALHAVAANGMDSTQAAPHAGHPMAFNAPVRDLDLPVYTNSGGRTNVSPALHSAETMAAIPPSSTVGTSPGPWYDSPRPSPDYGILPPNAHFMAPVKSEVWRDRMPTYPSESNIPAPASPVRPVSSKGNLPVFSSTGHIPFAPSSGNAGSQPISSNKQETDEKNIWEVPETPAK